MTMTASKFSISLSNELDQALEVLAVRSGRPKSAVIEMALRENPLVAHYIEVVRAEFRTEPIAVPGRVGREMARARNSKRRQRVSP